MTSKLAKTARWAVRLTGPLQVALGVALWTGHGWSLLPVHMLNGMVFDLALLMLVVVAASRGLRPIAVLGGTALVIAIPLFGIVHASILPGSLHWLVRSAHLLLGIGAMVVANRLAHFVETNPRPAGQAILTTIYQDSHAD